MMHPISRTELWHAQLAIIVAIVLQLSLSESLRIGPAYLVAGLELLLVFGIWFTAPRRHKGAEVPHSTISVLLIGLISLANAGQLALLIRALVNGTTLPGKSLLTGALAIFITNIIMFGLWYWELGSPGLSGHHKSDKDEHFLFPQVQSGQKNWSPAFFDYLYVSITNSTAFSPTDTMPLTHTAKLLMSTQAMISLLTVVLVTARAVNILG
ncbi:hypothetical protein KW803_01610 [Candidatus Saccharibacteria bacterium]|nr:hypothetical protein [Candidatus Saccharibacteria bacterium]